MPKWLIPWMLPVAMLVAVVMAREFSPVLAWVCTVVLVGALLIHLRLRYLKHHPPDPELTHRPFWRP